MVQTSYDIIKAHGGELKVETKEIEYTELLFTYRFNQSINNYFESYFY